MKALTPLVLLASAGGAALVLANTRDAAMDYATAPGPLPMMGVNLASGEFAPERVPGVHGKDYRYPTDRTAAPFLAAGMNTLRIPLLWERLQPAPNGPLLESEMVRIDRMLSQLSGAQTIVLDLHNYGRYRGKALDPESGARMLADFWSRLSARYGRNSRVAFGIMNEPTSISARDWRLIADQAVSAIRMNGSKNLILVPGTRWTGAHSWSTGGDESNAAAMTGFKDPAGNFAIEVHQYLDYDSSGKDKKCSDKGAGSRRIAGFTRWARAQRVKAVLGEFGASSDLTCLAALDDMLRYMARNRDVWIGWTYWAGGDWWGDYAYSIQPRAGQGEKPQFTLLRRYLQQR